MATDPETKARYEKANGYLHGRKAAPPAALPDLAASNPAVRTSFERAGLLPISESSARAAPPRLGLCGKPPAAILGMQPSRRFAPRGALSRVAASLMRRAPRDVISVAAKVIGEAYVATRAAPSLVPHPTVRGAATWDSVIALVSEEAGLTDKAPGLAKRI